MRNVTIDEVDSLPTSVLAIATDYPPGHLLVWHRHRRAQVLYSVSGVLRVETADGMWTVPPQQAVLIPPDTDHQVQMFDASTRSLYVEPQAVPWFPGSCRVVDVSPLLRELLIAAVELPPQWGPRSRAAAVADLMLHEIQSLSPLPFDIPMPADPRLRARCEDFASAPRIDHTPTQWAADLAISARSFTRWFKAQTGVTFQTWRERACALDAIRRLVAGTTVTETAAALGYASPAAFTVMFIRCVGTQPRSFRPHQN